MHIRDNLTASHDAVWRHLAGSGTWLFGAERVAVAEETRAARHCRLCAARKKALSAASVEGVHDTTALSAPRIESIHKLVNDPGRITRAWVNGLLADGLEDAVYVEITGLVSVLTVVDTFHAALGMPLRSLPASEPGEPTRRRPRTARDMGGYVPMVPADGLCDDYTDLYDTDFNVPSVHRSLSLVPAETRIANHLMASHYLPYEQVPHYTDADHDYAIDKMQIELLASRVSMQNNCFY